MTGWVKTVGALVTVIGGSVALWSAALQPRSDNPVDQAHALGIGAAVALAAIDTVYVCDTD